MTILTTSMEKYLNATHTTIFFKEYEFSSKENMGHFHIHLVAWKPNDFENKDDVFKYLSDYDKEWVKKFSKIL